MQQAIEAPAFHTTHVPSSFHPREAFPLMKANYYRQMGWDEQTGKPLPETLRALDLEELIPDFWAEAPAAQGLRVGG